MDSGTSSISLDYLQERRRANSEMNHLEFLQGRSELISLPRRIIFELTNRCDRRCCMPCGREESGVLCDLPIEVIRRFEGVLAFVEEVSLHGWGEGTLHPGFTEILGFLNSIPGLRKNFVTNGSTLDRIHWNIFEHHVDALTLFLDGICPLSGEVGEIGFYEGKFSSLRKLQAEKERRGKDYPAVNFVFTAMRRNLSTLPDILRWAADLRVPEIEVEYMTVYSSSLLSESLFGRQEEVRTVFAEARRLAGTLRVRLHLPAIQVESDDSDSPHRKCPLAWRDLYVGSNGRLRPCKTALLEFGSAGEWENFYDLWNSPDLQDFRSRVNGPGVVPDCCLRCHDGRYANFNLAHSFLQLPDCFPSSPAPDIPSPPRIRSVK